MVNRSQVEGKRNSKKVERSGEDRAVFPGPEVHDPKNTGAGRRGRIATEGVAGQLNLVFPRRHDQSCSPFSSKNRNSIIVALLSHFSMMLLIILIIKIRLPVMNNC